jgi:RNA polymerase sigma-70 factor (ECF subfamily)
MAARSLHAQQEEWPAAEHDNFMRLFVQVQPRLHAYIRTQVPNRSDAEEILQETGIVLWRRFGEFDPDTDFTRWAFRVARLQVLSFYKSSKRDVLRFSQAFVETMAEEAVAAIETSSAIEALSVCLEKLRPSDRDLIRQRYESSAQTTREVAREKGQAETTIYNALARIRRNLLRCVQRSLQSQ